MQSKGAIKFVAILLLLASLWQLSFTAVNQYYEGKAEEHAKEATLKLVETDSLYAMLPENEKAFRFDQLEEVEKQKFIDSLSREDVYFGYTLKDVMAKSINLGLDLKGGMNVTLQVQLKDLVVALAGNKKDTPVFVEAVNVATKNEANSGDDFITLFAASWNKVAGGQKLTDIFTGLVNAEKLKNTDSNEKVIEVLRGEAESAIANSFNVIRNRIDGFGVIQPNIQKLGNNGRILVELPGVKDPERVKKLLQGTASLEFWDTYLYSDVADRLALANELLDNKLFSKLSRPNYDHYACIGYAHEADRDSISAWLNRAEVKKVLKDLKPMWGVKPMEDSENIFELVAIRTTRDGKAKIDGEAIADASVQFSNTGGNPEVSMSMTAKGATAWKHMTRDACMSGNAFKQYKNQIAIVLDGMVYSYPTVQNEISGGQSQITGNFTLEEAEDLVNVLKSGKLPAPAEVLSSQVVGPSLGAESINAGFISFILAFVLVLLYMIIFYSRAGLIADVALLCNVVLLFGTLVSFGAVLTLPGIAGLVLTLGMAVDANVIIYERVKEELRAGKGLSKAVADGYKNAYSAIIDGQITTLLTGIVLFSFGSGPVQGFATTLIIGIITSVITSIFITRLIIDGRIEKGKSVSFDNKFTRNFLQNTHVDFISKRKIAYVISGLLIVGSIVSMSTKGFSYGVDFTGGRTYVIRFNQPVKAEDARKAVTKAFELAAANDSTVTNSSVEVKQFGGDSQIKITTTYKVDIKMNADSTSVDEEVTNILYSALKDFYVVKVKTTPDKEKVNTTSDEQTLEERVEKLEEVAGLKTAETEVEEEKAVATYSLSYEDFISTQNTTNGIISSDMVGPTIADDITRSSLFAVLISLLVIFGYIAIRFRGWTWGLGGVVGLAHTAIIVIGFFSVFSGILPFSLDIDQTFIAAILTIIGYAINDTVVIFDRIREFKELHPKADFKLNVNEALNSTLSRTMNTSLTTLITMVAIAIFGGEVIRGLAVALIIGIVIGTYASIFIATPIMYDVTKKADTKKAKK